jgi:hypothetical protein
MIKDPVSTFEKVLDFLGESKERLSEYEKNLEEFRKKTIDFYEKKKGSFTKGESFRFYRKNVPLQLLEEIDRIVSRKYPVLWKKYLFKHSEYYERMQG